MENQQTVGDHSDVAAEQFNEANLRNHLTRFQDSSNYFGDSGDRASYQLLERNLLFARQRT
jgi:hypothetical protein